MSASKPYWYFHICECGDYRHQHTIDRNGDHGECWVCGPGGAAHVPEEIRYTKYKFAPGATDKIWGGTKP